MVSVVVVTNTRSSKKALNCAFEDLNLLEFRIGHTWHIRFTRIGQKYVICSGMQ